MPPKSKTVFVCSECGYESGKWLGKCPACSAWNTMSEFKTEGSSKSGGVSGLLLSKNAPTKLSSVNVTKEVRILSGISELDRVLGGGIVKGSLVLVGGDPGIGKSTLLLQLVKNLNDTKIFYVSGEESEKQLKMRASRLNIEGGETYVMSETDMSLILEHTNEILPDILVIDSVQTMYNPNVDSAPGSVTQIRDVTMSLMRLAKNKNIAVFVVGHVTKDGALAGPKILEHMVDCVLYFEGERHQSYRILRAVKNRFGSTNEIGVFEMRDSGLIEVPNPSKMLLDGKPENASGSAVVCTMEGTRPMLAEVQALVSPTSFGMPRRTATGFDFNRVNLLVAVLEKRVGLNLQNQDVYVNIIGGIRLLEPAADLAVCAAIASSFRNSPIPDDVAIIGEVGLTGELRAINHIDKRVAEIKKLGFKNVIIPKANLSALTQDGINVIGASSVTECLGKIL
ncbi:MAG: DNA repair protein RadA [Clostridia bacterium]|nr:DNA repair protein RadA [Clostridia bacterium]